MFRLCLQTVLSSSGRRPPKSLRCTGGRPAPFGSNAFNQAPCSGWLVSRDQATRKRPTLPTEACCQNSNPGVKAHTPQKKRLGALPSLRTCSLQGPQSLGHRPWRETRLPFTQAHAGAGVTALGLPSNQSLFLWTKGASHGAGQASVVRQLAFGPTAATEAGPTGCGGLSTAPG